MARHFFVLLLWAAGIGLAVGFVEYLMMAEFSEAIIAASEVGVGHRRRSFHAVFVLPALGAGFLSGKKFGDVSGMSGGVVTVPLAIVAAAAMITPFLLLGPPVPADEATAVTACSIIQYASCAVLAFTFLLTDWKENC